MDKNAKSQILHKGHLFYKHYCKDNKRYWRCTKINAPNRCPARLFTDDYNVSEINEHNHVDKYLVSLDDHDLLTYDNE